MNILLTSAGRRTYMVNYFKEALEGKGLLFAANSQMSPALLCADEFFISPMIYSEEYIPFLMRICQEKKVDLIVSFFDIDAPVLSLHKKEFEAIGVTIAVSDKYLLENCSDKLKMGRTLDQAGIGNPKTFTACTEALEAIANGSVAWPLLIKPRFGMGSIGVLKAYNETELLGAFSMCSRAVQNSYLKYESAAAADESVLIQELKPGTEYGLDIISDLDGKYVNTIIRRKYAMRSGETDEAIILGAEDKGFDALMKLGKQMAETFAPVGLIDVDVMMDEADCTPYVIDINARFGGGYPFSHVAGANVPKAYVIWAEAGGLDGAAKAARMEEAAGLCKAKPGVHGYKDIVPDVYK